MSTIIFACTLPNQNVGIFQKLHNQKPKKEATSLNEARIQALSKNNNVEDTPQDCVITQGKHLEFRGKIHQNVHIFTRFGEFGHKY